MQQSGRTVFQRHRTRGATEQTMAKTSLPYALKGGTDQEQPGKNVRGDTHLIPQSGSTLFRATKGKPIESEHRHNSEDAQVKPHTVSSFP